MLVLTRKLGEQVQIGDDIVVTVTQVGPNSIKLGVEAPPGMTIARQELVDALRAREDRQERVPATRRRSSAGA